MKGLKRRILQCFLLLVIIGFIWWFWGVNIKLLTGGSFPAPKTIKYGHNAIKLTLGTLLIFRTPDNQYGAIRFDRMTDDWGADYTCWFKHKRKGLSSIYWNECKQHVFEKYWRTRINTNSHKVKDLGGAYQIPCGNITLNWSAPTWIYFPKRYSVTVIQAKNINNVDIFDKTIIWRISPFDEGT
jgi:hypothetical protein